jgi:serine/threonine-protein kinase
MNAQNDEPGFVPDGYEVAHKLGSGQTSHVYLARHPEFGSVALKLPRVELQARPVLRRMFENEVQITVKLDHPNVVTAYDGFPTGARAFLALEYCAGGTLDQRLLEKGRLALDDAYDLVLDVTQGLAYTHERSVLHRDVKPANVFLTAEGSAKLGDFGTGVFQADDAQERVGTAFYMAPEIFEGGRSTVRADVYSLGVLAYEVVSGERPFVGDTYDSLMVAHLSGIPRDLMVLRPELPRSVVRVITRAMGRDAGKRFGSAREFLTAFRQASGRHSEPEPEPDAEAPRPLTGRASRTPRASQKADGDADGGKGGLFGWLKRRKD